MVLKNHETFRNYATDIVRIIPINRCVKTISSYKEMKARRHTTMAKLLTNELLS